jgi:hypothetical protein
MHAMTYDRRRLRNSAVTLLYIAFLLGQTAKVVGQTYPVSGPTQTVQSSRAPVKVGLPNAFPASFDRLIVQPQVEVGGTIPGPAYDLDPSRFASQRPSADLSSSDPSLLQPEFLSPVEALPSPMSPVSPQATRSLVPIEPSEAVPLFESIVGNTTPAIPKRSVFARSSSGEGLGRERLAFSLFDIDPAQPFNNFRIRTALGYNLRLPDRSEYFWAKTQTGKGPPKGESTIDYQAARLRMETGSKKFSTAFEVPIIAIDPENNQNHAGLGDLRLATKTVIVQGKEWMLTQFMGFQFPTGNAAAGLGTGHMSMEPGLLFRNQMREQTWMHGEFKFLFPLGSDPMHGGQVLKFATGFNTVWSDTDKSAWVPSLELSAFSVLNGMATPTSGIPRAVDNDAIFYITPGLHYAVDRGGDFGLFDVGTAVSIAMSRERFTDSTWIFDMRWSW